MNMESKLIYKEHFQLANELIINLSLDWDTQKKILDQNLNHTTCSFGRGYPVIILNVNQYDVNHRIIKKDPYDHKYYTLDYEYDLSKVRAVGVYNQFSSMVTLWERHGFWSFLK